MELMDPTDELLATVFARPDGEWELALDEVCALHGAVALELRRRFSVLRRMGMADIAELRVDSAADHPVPASFGPYRLVQRLGGGGMGIVYLARHEELGRNVALKLVRPELLFFGDARERFRREIEAVARLEHPGCVQIHQVGEEQGMPYFAMEHIAGASLEGVVRALASREVSELTGQDLAAVLSQATTRAVDTAASGLFSGPWSRVCLRVVLAAAEAIEHAHARGVIHRDVKPSNLMLTREGRVVVIDFGLAVAEGASRMTRSGTFLGSLPYMAPEQVRGDSHAIDARTDVYAMGVCLYEVLTLVSPFESESAELTRGRILTGSAMALRARNTAVSADVAVICGKAMDVDPRQRYQRMADFAADLAAVLEHRAIAARPASALLTALRWARRRPALATGMAALAVVLLAGPLIVSLAIAGQRDRAIVAEGLGRDREYIANVNAASGALIAGNAGGARQRLDACPPQARGFEWHHIAQALDSSLLTMPRSGASARITAVTLSADGSKIASGAETGEVGIFDVATTTRLHTFQTGARVKQVQFNTSATELFACSVDPEDHVGHLRVFGVATGALLRERPPDRPLQSVFVSPGARQVFVDHGGGHFVQYDPRSLQLCREFDLEAATELPHGLFISDGEYIVAAMAIGGVATWDVASGRLLRQMSVGFAITCIGTQPSLARIACADASGNLAWIDTQSSTPHPLDLAGRIAKSLSLTSDGLNLIVGCATGELRVYGLSGGTLVRTLHGHTDAVDSMSIGTEADSFVTGSSDGSVRLWSPYVAQDAVDLPSYGEGGSLIIDGNDHVLFGGARGVLRCFDPHTGIVRWQNAHPHWVNAAALACAGTVVVTTYQAAARFIDAASGVTLGEVSLPPGLGYCRAIAADADGRRVFLGGEFGHLVALDVEQRAVLRCEQIHKGRIWGLVYDLATATLLSSGDDGWLCETPPDLSKPRRIVKSTDRIAGIVLDGSDVICSESHALCRRARGTGDVLQRSACPRYFRAMALLGPDRLVTGSEDGAVGFWDRRGLQLIVELKQPALRVRNLVIDPKGRWLVVAFVGGDPRVLYAEREVTSDFARFRQRTQNAAALAMVAQSSLEWPWSPATSQAIDLRADLSPELRRAAKLALPPNGVYFAAANALTLGRSAASFATHRKQLLQHRQMLAAALNANASDPHLLVAAIGLGLVCIRLGDFAAALSAVQGIGLADLEAGNQLDLCFIRAVAHRRVGVPSEAAAAMTALRALVAGKFAVNAQALAYLREADESNR